MLYPVAVFVFVSEPLGTSVPPDVCGLVDLLVEGLADWEVWGPVDDVDAETECSVGGEEEDGFGLVDPDPDGGGDEGEDEAGGGGGFPDL